MNDYKNNRYEHEAGRHYSQYYLTLGDGKSRDLCRTVGNDEQGHIFIILSQFDLSSTFLVWLYLLLSRVIPRENFPFNPVSQHLKHQKD